MVLEIKLRFTCLCSFSLLTKVSFQCLERKFLNTSVWNKINVDIFQVVKHNFFLLLEETSFLPSVDLLAEGVLGSMESAWTCYCSLLWWSLFWVISFFQLLGLSTDANFFAFLYFCIWLFKESPPTFTSWQKELEGSKWESVVFSWAALNRRKRINLKLGISWLRVLVSSCRWILPSLKQTFQIRGRN